MLLDFFRRNEKLAFWIILPCIVIPFVFYYGGGQVASVSGETGTVAEILNQSISADDVAEEAARCFGNGSHRDPMARAMALNRLLALAAVRQSGLSVGDSEVDGALDRLRGGDRNIPSAFWSFEGRALSMLPMDKPEEGEEGADAPWMRQRQHQSELARRFYQLCHQRAAQWTTGELRKGEFRALREVVREELLLHRHALLLADSAKATTAELFDVYLRNHTRLKARWARAETKAFGPLVPSADLSEEALKAFFETRKDQPDAGPGTGYQVPERWTVEYLLADVDLIAQEFPVDPADVEAYYTAHLSEWKDPETQKVQTLDEARPQIVKELNREKVVNRIDDLILASLDAPAAESFPDLARRLSLQTGSATVSRSDRPVIEALGQVDALFETLEELEPGERASHALDCGKGRCLLRLASREAAHAGAFEEVRARALDDLRARKAKALAENALRALKAQAGPTAFEAASEVLRRDPTLTGKASDAVFEGLTYGATEPFQNPRVTSEAKLPEALQKHPQAVQDLFELKEAGDLTEPAFTEGGAEGILLQIQERLPPEPADFLKERGPLSERYRSRIAEKLMDEWKQAIDSRARFRRILPDAP
jgi:hypothetical protein